MTPNHPGSYPTIHPDWSTPARYAAERLRMYQQALCEDVPPWLTSLGLADLDVEEELERRSLVALPPKLD